MTNKMKSQNRGWRELFPTRWSFVIFILYMALFINQGILVTASQTSNHQGYAYNTVMAVLLTEIIKLFVSAGIYVQSVHSQSNSVVFDDNSWVDNSSSKIKTNKNSLSASSTLSPTNYYCSQCLKGFSSFCYHKCNIKGSIIHRSFNIIRHSMAIFVSEIRQNGKVFFLYFIPASLYCVYNNLAYENLINFDPTTYFLLLQFRVVVTGLVFQTLFKKRLSKYQWISLILLTVGCMVKEINFSWLLDSEETAVFEVNSGQAKEPLKNSTGDQNKKELGLLQNPTGMILIFLQILFSSSAGVYNEFLLKRPSSNNQKQLPVLIQNVCLYIDSIICNLVLLTWKGNLAALTNFASLKYIVTTPVVLAVVLNNAAIGIVTSFFLAQLNSILKTFASALELMFTAVLCWMIFGIPIYANTVMAIFIVTIAIWLYTKEPVHNPSAPSPMIKVKEQEDIQKMLEDELDV